MSEEPLEVTKIVNVFAVIHEDSRSFFKDPIERFENGHFIAN